MTIKRRGLLVKPSVFRKKRGSFSEALNLSAKFVHTNLYLLTL